MRRLGLQPAAIGASRRGAHLPVAIHAGIDADQPRRAARHASGPQDRRAARGGVRPLAPKRVRAAAHGRAAAAAVAADARGAVGVAAAHSGTGALPGVGPVRRAFGVIGRTARPYRRRPCARRAGSRAEANVIGRVGRVRGVRAAQVVGRAGTAVGGQQSRTGRTGRAVGPARVGELHQKTDAAPVGTCIRSPVGACVRSRIGARLRSAGRRVGPTVWPTAAAGGADDERAGTCKASRGAREVHTNSVRFRPKPTQPRSGRLVRNGSGGSSGAISQRSTALVQPADMKRRAGGRVAALMRRLLRGVGEM